MATNPHPARRFAWLRSIRWQLPLTYAAIVLLTVITLATVLLFALDGYYSNRETAYMMSNANAIANRFERQSEQQQEFDTEMLTAALLPASFLTRSRIRVLDPDGEVIVDSATSEAADVLVFSLEPELQAQVMPEGATEPIDVSGATVAFQVGRLRDSKDGHGDGERPPAPDYVLWASDAPFGYEFGQRSPTKPETQRSDVVVSVPLHDPDGAIVGYLEFSEGPAFGTDVIQSVIRHLLLAAALVVPLAIAVGFAVSRNLSQPIMRLTHAAEQMAGGDLGTRVQIDRSDELGQLSAAFDGMANQIEHTVNTLQQFVADAAHEIKTPITAMRTNLELAEAGITNENTRSDLALAQRELSRLERLTSGLLALARLESRETELVLQPLDVAQVIRQLHEQFASRAEQAGISLETVNAARPAMIAGEREQVIRMLENLLENAVKFTPEGGRVTVGLEAGSTPGTVQIKVQDTGIGIPEKDLARLFSRFHRGRNASAYPGNGLGLVIVKTIVEEHGGSITVESGSGGTTFTVGLPQLAAQDKSQ